MKIKKKCIVIFSLLLIFSFSLFFNFNYAALGEGLNEDKLNDLTASDNSITVGFSDILNNVFGTLFTVLKVLGVAGIVITGVRYMYAGPDAKGKIKESLIYLILGTIFVFGADVVVGLISNAWNTAV